MRRHVCLSGDRRFLNARERRYYWKWGWCSYRPYRCRKLRWMPVLIRLPLPRWLWRAHEILAARLRVIGADAEAAPAGASAAGPAEASRAPP